LEVGIPGATTKWKNEREKKREKGGKGKGKAWIVMR
jgi:hypothetical protein